MHLDIASDSEADRQGIRHLSVSQNASFLASSLSASAFTDLSPQPPYTFSDCLVLTSDCLCLSVC